jgi:hypothetical protein
MDSSFKRVIVHSVLSFLYTPLCTLLSVSSLLYLPFGTLDAVQYLLAGGEIAAKIFPAWLVRAAKNLKKSRKGIVFRDFRPHHACSSLPLYSLHGSKFYMKK